MDAENAIREIDHALAALADVKPLADYGVVGTYDTVQARRQRALAQAEQSLLNLRRELAGSDGVKECECASGYCAREMGVPLRDSRCRTLGVTRLDESQEKNHG